jgi:hypothetical protein
MFFSFSLFLFSIYASLSFFPIYLASLCPLVIIYFTLSFYSHSLLRHRPPWAFFVVMLMFPYPIHLFSCFIIVSFHFTSSHPHFSYFLGGPSNVQDARTLKVDSDGRREKTNISVQTRLRLGKPDSPTGGIPANASSRLSPPLLSKTFVGPHDCDGCREGRALPTKNPSRSP